MLRDNGYSIIEMWDITYPALWLMRRVYTAINLPPRWRTPIERSMISTGLQAWDMGVICMGGSKLNAVATGVQVDQHEQASI